MLAVMVTRTEKRLLRPDFAAPSITSSLLADFRLVGASLTRFTLRARKGFVMSGMPYMFIVAEGHCRVGLPDGRTIKLEPGDAVMALGGAPTQLAVGGRVSSYADMGEVWDANAGPPTSLEGYERPVDIAWGDGPVGCVLIGSAMTLSHRAGTPPVQKTLPAVLLARDSETRLRFWTAALVQMLDAESAKPSDGFAAISTMTSQFLMAQILRTHLAANAPALSDMLDKGRSRALASLMRRLQRHPENAWTLADMAKAAGMSRTAFAEVFARATGTTPFRYLTGCRMNAAADLLRNTDLPITDVADRCGYRSERAFRDAFVQAHSMRPLAFRKAQRAKDDAIARP